MSVTPAVPPERRLHVAGAVAGGLVALVGVAALLSAIAALALDRTRGGDGYVAVFEDAVETDTYAAVTEGLRIRFSGAPEWLIGPAEAGTIQVKVSDQGSNELFVGVAAESDVDSWLAGVAHDRYDGGLGPIAERAGGAPAGRPEDQDIWLTSTTAAGTGVLTWSTRSPQPALVVMNADASPGLSVKITVGASVERLATLGFVLIGAGVVMMAAGTAVVWRSLPAY